MEKIYFRRLKPQIVIQPRAVSFIIGTNSLFLFLLLTVSWYLTTQESIYIYMTLAARDLVTGSLGNPLV